jgi:transaldolase/glucose-6-phosphate isomerase
MNPLQTLQNYGQAVWLDFLARKFLHDGGLTKLVAQDGLRGVTSNPSIFEKAIGSGTDYDPALKSALESADSDVGTLYEGLAVKDIQTAADQLRPVYESTEGHDGFVSLEVSPYLAMATDATLDEARRLWHEVDRPNLMIKVPGTKAGIPAVRTLLSEGINVNITLLFSQKVYDDVVEAYIAGLEAFTAKGGDPGKVASVASFFVSRIDTAVDKLLDEKLAASTNDDDRETLQSLHGKVAVANAKLAYQLYKQRFAGARWEKLAKAGARAQRLLWASTGTKNKAYSDVLYVEELIGDNTVNTMPPATMDAFRDHGKPRASLEENVDAAKTVMATLQKIGISIDEVTQKLVEDGTKLFADAFDELLGAVAGKRASLLGKALDSQTYKVPYALQSEIDATIKAWSHAGNGRRLWTHDASLWTGSDEAKWLGWLDIVDREEADLDTLRRLSEDVRKEEFSHVLLLGMGGSSLGPEVLSATFGRQKGHPELLVLDSTDPAQIRAFESRIDPSRTLFIVSSKSGSTLEPNILKAYFFERAKAAVGADKAASRFIAITDPGSSLDKAAAREKFRHIAHGDPAIGGRYSVLSDFGVVPAAAMGVDLEKFLAATQKMVRACAAAVPPATNPGIILGIVMGVLAGHGRDKVTIVASPGIGDFGAWLEQLVAESTGKHGKGLIPLDGEPLAAPEAYGADRLFAYLRLDDAADAAQDRHLDALEAAGHPVVRIAVTDRYHIGQEFFRWEIATAVAGAIIGINPFDQPDVEASKLKTRELTDAFEKSGELPAEKPFFEGDGVKLFAAANAQPSGGGSSLVSILKAHIDRLQPGDYAALLAYIERNGRHHEALQEIRKMIRDRKHVATCLGFGPRFLHSTGQAYKGGPNSGVFLQITCDDANDLAVPGHKYSFGIVKAAQARGDFEVLAERHRRLLRVHLGSHVAEGLTILRDAMRQALS